MTAPGTDVAPVSMYDTGLDDLTPEDLTVPRIKINHKMGVFEESGTNEQFSELYCVMLGLVRQRVLFHHNVEDGDVPICKSVEFQVGYPNVDPERKPKFNFPWELARLNPADFPPNQDGLIALPCEGCHLKEWGSHPTGEKPYCSEQFTMPLYYARTLEELQAEEYGSALISFQKTGVPPCKKYLSGFQQKKVGAYTKYTRITLRQLARGNTEYSVPVFTSVGDTPTSNFQGYSENFAAIRTFLHNTTPTTTKSTSEEPVSAVPATPTTSTRPPLRPEPTPAAAVVQPNVPNPTTTADPWATTTPANTAIPGQVVQPGNDDLPF